MIKKLFLDESSKIDDFHYRSFEELKNIKPKTQHFSNSYSDSLKLFENQQLYKSKRVKMKIFIFVLAFIALAAAQLSQPDRPGASAGQQQQRPEGVLGGQQQKPGPSGSPPAGSSDRHTRQVPSAQPQQPNRPSGTQQQQQGVPPVQPPKPGQSQPPASGSSGRKTRQVPSVQPQQPNRPSGTQQQQQGVPSVQPPKPGQSQPPPSGSSDRHTRQAPGSETPQLNRPLGAGQQQKPQGVSGGQLQKPVSNGDLPSSSSSSSRHTRQAPGSVAVRQVRYKFF